MEFIRKINTNGAGYWTETEAAVLVTKLNVSYINDEGDFAELRVQFDTDSWDTSELGLVYTDPLFLDELLVFLADAGFDADGVDYSEQGMQGKNYVSFDVDEKFINSWLKQNNTLDGVPANKVSKEDALAYCHTYKRQFVDIDGLDQFDGLIVVLESGTIDPIDLADYGMSDQELGL